MLELLRGIRIGLRARMDHPMRVQLRSEGDDVPAPAKTGCADFVVPLRAELGYHLTEGLALGFEVACASAELGAVSVPGVVSQASLPSAICAGQVVNETPSSGLRLNRRGMSLGRSVSRCPLTSRRPKASA